MKREWISGCRERPTERDTYLDVGFELGKEIREIRLNLNHSHGLARFLAELLHQDAELYEKSRSDNRWSRHRNRLRSRHRHDTVVHTCRHNFMIRSEALEKIAVLPTKHAGTIVLHL